MDWKTILYLIGAGLLVWFAFRMIKGNPNAFSKENMSKSVSTVGVLTLILIGIIAIAVLFLKNSS